MSKGATHDPHSCHCPGPLAQALDTQGDGPGRRRAGGDQLGGALEGPARRAWLSPGKQVKLAQDTNLGASGATGRGADQPLAVTHPVPP